MKYVDIAEFVPRCLEYVDEVEATGVTIAVLQNGRTLVHVAPYVGKAIGPAGAAPSPAPADPPR